MRRCIDFISGAACVAIAEVERIADRAYLVWPDSKPITKQQRRELAAALEPERPGRTSDDSRKANRRPLGLADGEEVWRTFGGADMHKPECRLAPIPTREPCKGGVAICALCRHRRHAFRRRGSARTGAWRDVCKKPPHRLDLNFRCELWPLGKIGRNTVITVDRDDSDRREV